MDKSTLTKIYGSLLSFYGKHELIPPDVFATQIGMDASAAKMLLDDLVGTPIKRGRGRPRKVPQAPPVVTTPVTTPIATSAPKPIREPEPAKHKWFSWSKKAEKPLIKNSNNVSEESTYTTIFLKIFALPLALVSMCLSTYFSYLFLQKQFSPLLAITVSGVMVIFNVFCFEAAGLFLTRKKIIWATFFGLLSLAVSIYSVGTTISGLYESYLVRIYNKQTSTQETNANRRLYDSYVEEEKEKQKLMDDKRARLIVHQNALKELDTLEKQNENRKTYDTAYWGAWQLEKDITVISKEISELRKKQQEVLKADAGITRDVEIDNKPDIYTWLSQIFHTSSDFMQFILQAIPAVSLDAIGSFSLYLFLFLRRKQGG